MGRSGIVWYLMISVMAAASGMSLYVFYSQRNPVALIAGLALLVLAALLVRVGRRPG